ncbi:hypothetical protein EC9_10550 [Rosistilla ulvae]|uniref:Uncharacterized protein n=1 Tax=Rosistilla ulvae TaxID=1930277 RepID=A0A517LW85_9BACT|nr:hypothetical protein EC9_10550 [Rosistilla ulvae]
MNHSGGTMYAQWRTATQLGYCFVNRYLLFITLAIQNDNRLPRIGFLVHYWTQQTRRLTVAGPLRIIQGVFDCTNIDAASNVQSVA